MLFDPRPKESRRELYDRDRELEMLARYVSSGSPIILCLGVRRIGKTSVLKVFVNESGYPHIYIDARRLDEVGYTKRGLYRLLSDEFTRIRGRFAELIEYLRRLRGVVVSGYGIEIDWRSGDASLSSILVRMDDYAMDNGTCFIVVIDEAQYLRYMRGFRRIDFRQVIAYAYDNLRHVKFILAGSEVGLLYRFLEFDNPSSPLYGRVRDEVVIERFSREESLEFLELGFSEAGMHVPGSVLEDVVESLDGIPGWLAYFGYRVVQARRYDIVDRVFNEAVGIALSELRRVASLSPLYRHVLRAVAVGYTSWSSIKRVVEAWTGRLLPSTTLYRILKNLMDMSILGKRNEKYMFQDPIYREAAKQL